MATINYTVNAIDSASGTFKRIALSADSLDAQLSDLSKRVASPTVDLSDKAFATKIADAAVKLNKLSAQIANPKVEVDTAKAQLSILKIEKSLDELDGKNVTATVSVRESVPSKLKGLFSGGSGGDDGGILSKLLGGGGGGGGKGGAGAASGGLSSLLSGGLTSPASIAGIGGLAALLGPGLIGLGVGGATGLGAIGGGLLGAAQGKAVATADLANIKQLTTQLKGAIGQQKQQISQALQQANKQYQKDATFFAPFTNFEGSIKDLSDTILTPLRSVLTPLTGIITQFGKGLTALGPQLTQLFKASLPFISQFATLMLQMGKALLPAFTQAMNDMVKSGALKLMTQGLLVLIQGFARFVVALGPGMKASAQIFVDVAKTISLILQATGKVASWLANVFDDFFHDARVKLQDWRADWDDARKDIATIFDGIRKDIAAAWDAIWSNSIGRIKDGISTEQNMMTNFRHSVANTFDNLRHDIASAWDAIWTNTVGRAESGVKQVGKAVDGLRDAFKTPINWVITNVLDRLISGFDWITSHIGLGKPIPTIKGFASGGRIPGFGGGDIVPAMLEPGEAVVDKRRTQQYSGVFKAMGVPGFASGGVVGNRPPGRFPGLPQPSAGSAPFGGGVLGDVEGFFKGVYSAGRISAAILSGNSKALTNAFSALIGHGAGGAGGDLAKMLVAIPATLVKDAVHWLISNGGAAGGSGSAGAIVDYARQYLGKIPYVFGGTSLTGGDDCSGFTQAIYKHFGYNAPRTSEEQGAWVKKSAPTPGGLVFFNSPAGGPPPGHVGIVMNGKQMISQAGPEGALGPTISSFAGNMFAGIPPGGFAKAGTSAKGRYTLPGLEGLWGGAGGPGGQTEHIAGAIALAESGGNPNARNPSGASGLWQILGQLVGGNIFNPQVNALNAVAKYRGARDTFSPWVTYETGAYRQFMDSGGTLPTGRSIVYNGTGHPEKLVRDDKRGQTITLEVTAGNSNAYTKLLVDELQKYVTVHGGDVQTALGQPS